MKNTEGMDKTKANEAIAMQVSVYSMLANFMLALGKLIVGVWQNSQALISDAIHSASDVFSTIVVMIGFKLSAKERDEDHQYGHERFECVAAIILAIVLFITGLIVGYKGIITIASGDYKNMEVPGMMAMYVAGVSIVIKEGMYWYTRFYGKKIKSSALMADAWHHRSDALSSVGSLAGIGFARIGYAICDPIASIVICVFIVKAAFDIFADATGKMTDKACDKEIVTHMSEEIIKVAGVEGIDSIQTRVFGSRIFVDLEIIVDGDKPLRDAHGIAENVHDILEAKFPDIKHCMVHVNPTSKQ